MLPFYHNHMFVYGSGGGGGGGLCGVDDDDDDDDDDYEYEYDTKHKTTNEAGSCLVASFPDWLTDCALTVLPAAFPSAVQQQHHLHWKVIKWKVI